MMTRITPRTCLWPLAASISFTFALSIGLTFVSNHHCYAGTCGEWLFPLQARLHVVVWYCWLSTSVTFLAIRAFHPSMRKVLQRPLMERKLPLLGKQLALSGVLVFFWIISLYGIIVGIWWVRLRDYFAERGIEGGVFDGNARLAAIALTGHMCDVTMGMALVPISRHSALASFFKLSVATTLTFHMITAYTLFTLVMIHGFLYVSWVPVFEQLSASLRKVYPVLNPTYLYEETWPGNYSSLGIWRASLIFTGSVTAFIMLLIFITTLPVIRQRHFNIFYFTHLLGIVAVVLICLHASTMFYCTSPGLMMWILDWSMRLYELRASLEGNINHLGKGWYCLSIPLPRRRLDGCACTSPLAHFYIYHSSSSIRELHPFTTTTHLASQNNITHADEDDIMIQFMFRKRGASKASTSTSPTDGTATGKEVMEGSTLPEPEIVTGFLPILFDLARRLAPKKKPSQWTDRIAGLADTQSNSQAASIHTREEDIAIESYNTGTTITATKSDETLKRLSNSTSTAMPISLRLEGPYFTPADPARFDTVVCLVAGTGVSGAMAISGAFRELERQVAEGGACPAVDCFNSGNNSTNNRRRSNPARTSENTRPPSTTPSPPPLRPQQTWRRCIILWSVREDDFISLPQLEISPNSALDIRVHLTGNGRKRLNVGNALDDILRDAPIRGTPTNSNENERRMEQDGKTWVYISGPNAFIATGEAACKERQGRGVEWYGARWDI